MPVNAEWHGAHPMPKNPTLEQRLEWHLEHQKHCACRPIPAKLQQQARDRVPASAAPTGAPADLLLALERAGKPQNVVIYKRHGVAEPTYGVAYGELDALAKRYKDQHALALSLWATGVHDARVLATKIADPELLSAKELTVWLAQAKNYVITDAIASLALRTSGAASLALKWIDARGEWTAAAGWTVVASLVLAGRLDPGTCAQLIPRIEREIHTAKNRTRHAMNAALIAIGGTLPGLAEAALSAARTIGEVEVDHGDTGCKTPDAVAAIERMRERDKISSDKSAARKSPRARSTTGRVRC